MNSFVVIIKPNNATAPCTENQRSAYYHVVALNQIYIKHIYNKIRETKQK